MGEVIEGLRIPGTSGTDNKLINQNIHIPHAFKYSFQVTELKSDR